MTGKRKAALAVAAAASGFTALAALSGCGGAADAAGCEGTMGSSHLAIVVGVHQNAPKPALHEALRCDIEQTLRAGNEVSLVALDGDPEVITTARIPATVANDEAKADAVTREMGKLVQAAVDAQATSDGSDLMAAIGLAADHAGTPDAQIIVLDSALPDRGALDMAQPGMLGASPVEVADFTAAQGHLPRLDGRTVTLVGVGYTTPPQQALTPGQRLAATDIVSEVLRHAGATARVIAADRTGEGPQTPFVTRPVPVTAPEPISPQAAPPRAVYDDTSALGFLPDSTQLRDPQAAQPVVAGIGQWLAADPRRSVLIEGTCASAGTAEGRQALSTDRAAVIKRQIVEAGAKEEQVEAVGLGYIGNPPDSLPDGTLDPAKAAQNRTVTITTRQN